MNNHKNFPRKLLLQKVQVNASPSAVFPLLCPVREYEWIPGWACEMIFSSSGFAEENCIFTTNPGDAGGKDVWVISRYEPPQRLEFVRVNSLRVIRYNISLTELPGERCEMCWEQVVTSLSEEGNTWLETYTREDFSNLILKIGGLLNKWFEKA